MSGRYDDASSGIEKTGAEYLDTSAAEAERPVIRVTNNPHAIRQLGLAIECKQIPEMYVTDGELTHIERVSGTPILAGDADSPLPVRPVRVTPPLLARLLAHHTKTVKLERGADVEWTPPTSVLSAVIAGSEWPGVPPFAGIIGTPVLRRDGTLLQEPGYDEMSGQYLALTVPIEPIPEKPTPEQVAEAKAFICDQVLGDFPWKSGSDKANYIGLMVTQIMRGHLNCRVPLGIITATMPASGKTILAGLIGLLAGQRTLSWADDDTELSKTITSAFATECGVVVFDNLAEGTAISSPVLAVLATGETWTQRLLGGNRMGSWTNNRLWLFTGNNLFVGGDILSRCVLIRLEPDRPNPETRTGQKIADLDTWILNPANRAKVLRALLIMIVDWKRAGGHARRGVVMRQFTTWADGVGGFLDHHGIGGFLDNVGEVRDRDDEDNEWTAFLAQFRKIFGTEKVTAGQLCNAPRVWREGGGNDPWAETFFTDRKGQPISAKSLGRRLKGQVGRFHGNYQLQGELADNPKQWIYWVAEYNTGTPVSGEAETNPRNPQTQLDKL